MTIQTTTPLELHPDWCGREDDCYDQIPDAATHASPMATRGAAAAQVEQVVEWIGGHTVHQQPRVLAWMNGESVGEHKPYL